MASSYYSTTSQEQVHFHFCSIQEAIICQKHTLKLSWKIIFEIKNVMLNKLAVIMTSKDDIMTEMGFLCV